MAPSDDGKGSPGYKETTSQSESGQPCATCNDDPAVCATVPGLRHCEKATRSTDKKEVAELRSALDRRDESLITRILNLRAISDRLQRELAIALNDVAQLQQSYRNLQREAAQSASGRSNADLASTAERRRAEWDALPKCCCADTSGNCHGYYNCRGKRCAGNCSLPGWVHFDCPTHGPGGTHDRENNLRRTDSTARGKGE